MSRGLVHGGDGWERLDARTVAIALSWSVAPSVPAVAAVVTMGPSLRTVIPLVAVLAVLTGIAAYGLLRYATTRYRVTGERVEVRSGLLFRRHRSVPRDRVRAVDVTAGPVHRLLGVAVVRIGAGEHESGLRLDAVSRSRAGSLRLLLGRENATSAPAALAELRPAWIAFALLSSWTPLIGLAPFGALFRVLEIFGVEPAEVGFLRDVWEQATRSSPAVVAVAATSTVLAIGVLGALLLHVEVWWGFRLTREPGGAYRMRRGLLTTRSLSLQADRLRGAELSEPLPLRWGGGARLRALVAGIDPDDREERTSAALLPPAPRRTALKVAAQVLGDPALTAHLRPHPRAALRLRLSRAVWPPAFLAVSLAGLGAWLSWVPDTLWLLAPACVPVALLLAADAHRSLGHGLTGRYLLTRYGTARRRTVALRRDAVIGWTVGRSPAQRRRGLMTLTAATAAGAYRVRDVHVGQGLAFAEEAVPSLLEPFIVPSAPPVPAGS
ncbi:PH domain-containing protein [Planomonospora sp. ID67723]|uniref:PH domain-containing protein n=1 Tax=Planomonospora sp. ID67723 TaxID=2738134 RepID=UPI0018C370B6|nr:PH domain-containing protein [Planomonospora sp. ID67723]MBG0827158.1 PH domain-containing protein [Planomonospora sp. ID67723]